MKSFWSFRVSFRIRRTRLLSPNCLFLKWKSRFFFFLTTLFLLIILGVYHNLMYHEICIEYYTLSNKHMQHLPSRWDIRSKICIQNYDQIHVNLVNYLNWISCVICLNEDFLKGVLSSRLLRWSWRYTRDESPRIILESLIKSFLFKQ